MRRQRSRVRLAMTSCWKACISSRNQAVRLRFFETLEQCVAEGNEIADIVEGVFELLGAERAATPVGAGFALLCVDTEEA